MDQGRHGKGVRAGCEGFNLQGGYPMKKSLTLAASAAALVTLSVGALRRVRQLVSVQDRGVGSAVRHGEPAHDGRLLAARQGVEALGDLRLLPAHEGRLLAGGRLRRRRGGQAPGRQDAAASRPAATPSSTSRSRRSRIASPAGAAGGHHRRHLVRRPEQPGRPRSADKNIPVIDVINGISSPELSAKSLVSFGEMGAKAGEYLAKLHPAGSARRSRSPGSPDRRAPAGSRPATPASSRR